jgi:hypothetical protein
MSCYHRAQDNNDTDGLGATKSYVETPQSGAPFACNRNKAQTTGKVEILIWIKARSRSLA